MRLLVVLRHPVDRAYSTYVFTVQRAHYRGSFAEFLDERPSVLERGFYSRYLERYQDSAGLMGVVEQVSRYDAHVNDARMTTMRHFAKRAERSIRKLQRDGLADTRLDPTIAADALGAMVARFAEIWLVQGYRDYDFDVVVEQLTRLWANALGLAEEQS